MNRNFYAISIPKNDLFIKNKLDKYCTDNKYFYTLSNGDILCLEFFKNEDQTEDIYAIFLAIYDKSEYSKLSKRGIIIPYFKYMQKFKFKRGDSNKFRIAN